MRHTWSFGVQTLSVQRREHASLFSPWPENLRGLHGPGSEDAGRVCVCVLQEGQGTEDHVICVCVYVLVCSCSGVFVWRMCVNMSGSAVGREHIVECVRFVQLPRPSGVSE